MTRYPDKAWRMTPHCPEELGGPFERAGFERAALAQLQMRAELS
jgi:hypothetical protein